MRKTRDLSGVRLKYGTVVAYSHTSKRSQRVWDCLCDCGESYQRTAAQINEGRGQHCGCMSGKLISEATANHGLTGTPEFKSWDAALYRCDNPNSKDYARYGGRGISVCDRWRDFSVFLSDMGPRPGANHTLDRIDANGNYEPGNCRWADHVTQQSNRRNNIMVRQNGKEITLFAFYGRNRRSGYSMACRRIARGWSVADAIFQPAIPRHERNSSGKPAA